MDLKNQKSGTGQISPEWIIIGIIVIMCTFLSELMIYREIYCAARSDYEYYSSAPDKVYDALTDYTADLSDQNALSAEDAEEKMNSTKILMYSVGLIGTVGGAVFILSGLKKKE